MKRTRNTRGRKYGRSRVEKALVAAKIQSASASPARSEEQHTQGKARSPCSFPARNPSSPSPPLNASQGKEKKKTVSKGKKLCTIFAGLRKKALLKPLFECTSMDRKSTEDPRKFPKALRVITLVRNTGSNLKVLDYQTEAKSAFPNIRMV